MHATELKRNHTTRHCIFAIDSADYLGMLPTSTRPGNGDLIKSTMCCAGSLARCLDGVLYALDGDDEWVEYSGWPGRSGGGASAYDIAVANGFQGTEAEWLESLIGNGIASIEKTGTTGSEDTYTITMTNGAQATFTVTNGTSAFVYDSGKIYIASSNE